MMPEFKLARYESCGYPDCGLKYGQVLYVIIGKKCIFTGLNDNATSTINACESIIEEILRLEGCQINDLRFYDLQTHLTYSSKKPGVYDLDHIVVHHQKIEEQARDAVLELQGHIVIGSRHNWSIGWNPVKLSPKIIELFRPCIGNLGEERTIEAALNEVVKAYNLILTISELN